MAACRRARALPARAPRPVRLGDLAVLALGALSCRYAPGCFAGASRPGERASASQPEPRRAVGRPCLREGGGRQPESSEKPRRSALTAAGLALVAPLVVPAPRARALETVQVYFGQGCFWHVQHELTRRSLKMYRESEGAFPEGSFSPAIAGYAGGLGKNPDGRICYNAYEGRSYDDLGHAEVVGLELPAAALEQMARLYFEEAGSGPTLPGSFLYSGSPEAPAGRHDPQDIGGAYRSAIGVPGGLASPAGKVLEQANAGRLQLVAGQGNDPDTLGKGVVYVYDTTAFPFHPAELYHQYHDDMSERYSKGYHGIKGALQKAGVISKLPGCET